MQKEVQSQRLLQFLSIVSNDQDAGYVDRVGLLRDIATSMELDPDDVIKSEERLQAEQQAQQQQLLQAQAQQGAGPSGVAPQGQSGMGNAGAVV